MLAARSGRLLRLLAVVALAGCGSSSTGSEAADAAPPGLVAAAPGTLALGGDHTSVLRGGKLSCWGIDWDGSLGYTSDETCGAMAQPCSRRPRVVDRPDVVPLVSDAIEVAAGWAHTCVRSVAGRVKCWGWGKYGQTGEAVHPDEPMLPRAPDLVDVAQIVAREELTCARLSDGSARCWGMGQWGQLGDGVGGGMERHVHHPVAVVGLQRAAELKVGGWHSCARHDDGTLSCWGDGENGKLGYAGTTPVWMEFLGTHQCSPSPQPVPGMTTVVELALGNEHTCALLADRTVRCWGDNRLGELGDGTLSSRMTPAPVMGLDEVVQITAGDQFSCARRGDGTVWCWGLTEFGRLGGREGEQPCGTKQCRVLPRQVAGLHGIVDLVLGGHHACAARNDGALLCWGRNQAGQVGDGTTDDRASPFVVSLP
jgi:alpha-tubulin suppressor-like RCC1 family protein